jgi:membrane protease YdiL (CAAX protease family)
MLNRELKRPALGALLLALVLVVASHAIPDWGWSLAYQLKWSLPEIIGWENYWQLIFLAFSACLVLHDPVAYGICLGEIRQNWRWVLLMCATPVLLTAIVYPRLPFKPFSGDSASAWLISPLAQDLLFFGYLYQRFEVHFPGAIHDKFPVKKCILVTAAYFALWHLPGLLSGLGWYLGFQLLYTFAGGCVMGLARQVTNSIIYITIAHMLVNWIAVNT